ncbi:MAG: pyridoxal phosphate-dependent aminotransferase [Clostridiales bacterium]|nr:pyridoxal phosphate-dependent aminotransferase [Clostridiales bacterium]
MIDERFDVVPDRHGSCSYKWDSAPGADVIPLWVADMDFKVAAPIENALRERVEHGVFGYTHVPESYYEAVACWYSSRYGVILPRSLRLIYTQGVVPAISATIKALTRPGDGVAIMTPVYNCFFSSIRNNGCMAVDVPLLRHDNEDGSFGYDIDYEKLSEALNNERTPVLLMCNPHNPACRAWRRDELQRVYDLCRATDTILLSDEIHGDLVMPGYRFTSVSALDGDPLENCVVFSSPSKAFNMAGLQIANILTSSPRLRYLIDRAINDNEVCDVNPFGVTALIAAYNQGQEWLDGLLGYIHGNYRMLVAMLSHELPMVKVARLEATYLAWLDVSCAGICDDALEDYLMKHYKVWVNAGSMYGAHGRYVRINLATSRERLAEGLSRFIAGMKSL